MFNFQPVEKFRGWKVKIKSKTDLEPHEVFLDTLAQKKEEELGLSEKKLEVPLLKKILQGFLIASLLLIFILFVKTFQLQIVRGEDFSALSRENKFIIQQIQAARGVIYGRNLNQLVFNQPSFDLVCQKSELPAQEPEKVKILKEISLILQENYDDLKKKIGESDLPQVLISQNLPRQTLLILETKISEFPGFQIERNWIREYQDGQVFSHLIGYTGKITAEELKTSENYSITDYVGRDGLEKSYEEILRKNPGKLQIERDVFGNIISKEIISQPESGKSLVLYLDSELQKKTEEELKLGLQETGAKKGAAVAIDPKTGGVLALVSLPDFDNNLFSQKISVEEWEKIYNDPLMPLFNRVVSGQYAPGSTIKPLIASGALEEKIISPQKKINCQGFIEVPHQYLPEITYKFQDWEIHGQTDLRKALAESCNVYFYTLGGGYKDQPGLGPSRIKKYLELFGWNQSTGIDIPGEEKGLIPSPSWKKENKKENWWDGDTYHLAIGQGDILVTPLQVATAFSAITNGGTLFKPQIVQKIVDKEKNLIEEIKPEIIRENFIKPENLQIVREGMRGAVTYGTSTSLNTLPVKAAAKTGTAETPKEDYYHNWITVFAPYDDPQIVLTIMMEDVKGFRVTVLPVAQAILEWYFRSAI